MSGANEEKVGLKKKIVHEMIEYYINFIYLFLFFGMFTTYRRLILVEYKIAYLHYGIALIKALVLAKVIMIGQALRLDRGLQDKPLIWITLYKTVVFTIWVFVFSFFEHLIEGLLHGKGMAGVVDHFLSNGDELLARCLVVFFAFIPFFAFKELGRVMGENRILDLFFRKGTLIEPYPSEKKE